MAGRSPRSPVADPHPPVAAGAEPRLRWWVLALPALAFAALLTLLATGAEADSDGTEEGQPQPVVRLIEYARQAWAP